MKELNEYELNTVNGGNDGDNKLEAADSPNGVTYLHQVGEEVAVFNSSLQIGTKHAVILDRRPKKSIVGCATKYVGEYYVKFDGGNCEWIESVKIQRS